MKLLGKISIVIFLFVVLCCKQKSQGKEEIKKVGEKEKITTIEDFLLNLNEISLPFSTENLPVGKSVTSDYFFFEQDNTYYELEGLKCFGFFKKDKSVYILYGFNLFGEGEGFADKMIVLSSFNQSGKHVSDIILKGSYGGEGGANVYRKAVVTDRDIIVDFTDEHYGSDTGLGYAIIEYKKEIYEYNKTYNLVSELFTCEELKSLEEYCLQFEKGFEKKDDSAYGLSYMLNNYLYCFPVTKENVSIYRVIHNYLKESGNMESATFLSEKIKNTIPNDNLIIVSVDNLRLRNTPGLKGEEIELLSFNSEVTYLGEKSKYQQEVVVNDRKIVDYWYKVKSQKGNIGWLHGCCVSFWLSKS